MEADRKQLQQREREGKLRDLTGKMNAAKNNREYQTLKEQIAADEKANSVLSDEIFEASEEVDALQGTMPGLEERVQLAEAEKTKMVALVEKKLESLHIDLNRVQSELAELENSLPSEFSVEYRRIVNARGMDALCPIDGNSCGGCYTNVTPRVLDRLRMGHPCICPSCGRMLYRPEN
jgi:predicted  nucleic acid-binding Zn-ribbon protein